jgi:diguanylate cyclase (GGDEF)-like protein
VIPWKRYLNASNDELAKGILDSYRIALASATAFGAQACPPIAGQFQDSLAKLGKQLGGSVTLAKVSETGQNVDLQFKEWGGSAAEYFKRKADEVREVMMVLAGATEGVAVRDHRYGVRFSEFSSRLRAIADLEDITRIRASIVENAQQLKDCVDQMSEESRKALGEMREKIATYENRLAEAERAATRDQLTGLENRRAGEAALELRIQSGRPFCLILVDLNDFKGINDRLGHLVGDQVLQEFAKELKGAFRATDCVARWGGDEFVVLMDGNFDNAQAKLDQIRNWVCGTYTVKAAGALEKLRVSAAAGAVMWQKGDTPQKMLERADVEMYREKRRR